MRVDSLGYIETLEQAGALAADAERFGYGMWWAPETKADAFLSCAVAVGQTESIGIGTGIAVAFARSPMTVAVQANDLQALSRGRFVLGLGSQIKPHIERRFSMTWSHPAARMREYVLAIRAIWKAWETGEKLDFAGEFYTHTLMSPFFDPGPNPHGNPKVILAAVGPKMTEVAGEVADGMLCHGFCTERYLKEVTLPALQRGAERAGRSLDGFEISAPGFVVARDSEEEIAAGVDFVRQQIGFYGSTPAYRPVLELHGWGGLQEQLNQLTKRGEWGELAGIVSDEVLDAFGIVGTPEEVAGELSKRYAGVATSVTLTLPDGAVAERWAPVFAVLRAPVAAASGG